MLGTFTLRECHKPQRFNGAALPQVPAILPLTGGSLICRTRRKPSWLPWRHGPRSSEGRMQHYALDSIS